MHRIDADAHVGNQFSDGDAGLGQPGTKCDSAWLNAVQEELAGAIEAAGITLVKGTNDQLAAAILAVANSAVLKCRAQWDGTLISAGSDPGFTTSLPVAGTIRFSHPRITANSSVTAAISRQGFTFQADCFAGYVDVAFNQRTDVAFPAPGATTPCWILVKP